MTLQHLKEQEMVEFDRAFPLSLASKHNNDAERREKIKNWLSAHDLHLEQAIREDERSKLMEALDRVEIKGYYTKENKEKAELLQELYDDCIKPKILLTLK